MNGSPFTKKLHLLRFLSLLGLVSSCTKELPMPDLESQSKVALIGEFVAGEPIQFRVGQSVPINSTNSLQFKILQDLNLSATDAWQNTYRFTTGVDTLTNVLFTLPMSTRAIAYPGNTYYLKGSHPQLQKLEAEVSVPTYFACAINDTARVNLASAPLMRFTISINDPAGATNYYCLEAVKQLWEINAYFFYANQWQDKRSQKQLYDSLKNAGVSLTEKMDTLRRQHFIRLPVYTDDVNSDNLSIGNPLNVNKRILLQDKNFQGNNAYHTHLFVETKNFLGNSEEEKGEVIILIKSVAKDYFDFLKSYEQYDAQQGLNSFDKPIKIEGNIRGGLGMLGGVYLHRFRYVFDQWTF